MIVSTFRLTTGDGRELVAVIHSAEAPEEVAVSWHGALDLMSERPARASWQDLRGLFSEAEEQPGAVVTVTHDREPPREFWVVEGDGGGAPAAVHFIFAGVAGTFDGVEWRAADPRVARLLASTAALLPPRYLPTLASHVRAVLADAGGGEVTQADEPEALPPDAIP